MLSLLKDKDKDPGDVGWEGAMLFMVWVLI